MKIADIDKLNIDLLGDAGFAVLYKGSDLTDKWIPVLARRLEVSDKELEEMLDQLRIFFALVIVAKNSRKLFPDTRRVPTEPPPLLKRLWAAMCADKLNYYKFIEAVDLNLHRDLEFQENYRPERHITVENARTLCVELAPKIGLPINEKYWELPKSNPLNVEKRRDGEKFQYGHIELCAECDYHAWVYFANRPGTVAFSLDKGIDIICEIMDSESAKRFLNDIEMLKGEGKFRSPLPT